MDNKIEFSYRSIIFTVLFLIGIWFLYEIRNVILALFVSIIIMFAFSPLVDRLEKLKIARWLAIALVYLLVFGGLIGLLVIIIPPLVEQTSVFINKMVVFLRGFQVSGLQADILVSQLTHLGAFPANFLKFILSLFSNIIGVLAFFVISFYLLLERKNLDRYLLLFFDEKKAKKAKKIMNEIEKRLGGWVRAEVTMMILVGLMSFIGLSLLGIEFALPLAILAGILEIVPNFGPTISAVPAVIVGLGISPWMGLAVVALYILVQQIENNLLTPNIIRRAVGLNPLVTILSLVIGFKLAGIGGAVLAVPVVLVIQTVAVELFPSKLFQARKK